ncbi:hypothetical protein AS200_09395 [Streptomyces sp. CdTB01]|nr:hypothetical protein AS200_09395 [Streptomyces sp. CdTB01]
MVRLAGQQAVVKAALDEFVQALPASVEVIRLGVGDPDAEARLRDAADDLAFGTPAVAARLVIVDDLDARPSGIGQVLMMAADAGSLLRCGVRIVIGPSTQPEQPAQLTHDGVLSIDADGYVHPRPALLDRVTAWAADPDGPGVLLVVGAPGTGKSFLLKDCLRVLDELPDTAVAFASIRAWVLQSPVDAQMSDLAGGLTQAFRSEGLDFTALADSVLTDVPAPVVQVEQTIGVNYGEVVGVRQVTSGRPEKVVDAIVAALTARAAAGAATTTLMLVLDALDEWETYGLAGLGALRSLLSRHQSFPAWNFKVLLSSQYRPDWLPAGATVDLDHEDAGPDLRSYALTRLAIAVPEESERVALAHRVAALSRGLFLVAAGYLDEIIHGDLTAADLADVPVARNAVDYCSQALGRIRDRYFEERGRAAGWLDAERFLSMLAVLPEGRSADDMLASWREPGVPTSTDWYFVRDSLAESPVRRYFAADETGSVYRFIHPAVRQAVAALHPRNEQTGVAAERRRWILRHTPIGRPDTAWDPVGRRAALAEVGTVLADLLAAAAGRAPLPDEHGLAEARGWVRELLEQWTWIETSIAHADPTAALPLGLPRVLQQIELILKADPALADDELWTQPRPVPLPAPAPPREPAPAATRPRPGRQQGLAHVRNAHVAEVLSGRATFATREQARARLDAIRRRYQLSRESKLLDDPYQIILFIRGYGLGPAELSQGRKGHYAKFSVVPLVGSRGRWVIRAQRHESSAGDPLPPSPPSRYPNWSKLPHIVGNPVTSRKAPTLYHTLQDAESALKRLRDKYPDAAASLPGKLLLRVYDRSGPTERASGKRFVLANTELVIVRVPAGFQIEARIVSHMSPKGTTVSHEEFLRLEREQE